MYARLVYRLASVGVVSALLVVSGCTDSDDRPSATATSESPTAQTSSSAPTPTPTTAPSEAPPADTALIDRLLPTGQVPGLNAQWHWQDGETGAPTPDPFGLCAQTAPGADLLSIGASEVVARTYFPPDDSDDGAAEQIADFPDARTASTAWTVLAAWHKRCGRTLSADNALEIGPFVSVPVEQGTARWYLLSWTPPGEETGRFEAFGMVLNGTRIAVLRMDNSGQDHDYPPDEEPMAGMLQAAAALLD